MDAVYERTRSQTTSVACDRTNRRGAATLEIDARRGADYLIRVAALANSVTESFALRVVAPDPPARFPGVRLPRGVLLELDVSPAVNGRATLLVERLDPLAGWLFHARYHPTAVAGRAALSFRPPSVGHWRVTGSFDGTPNAAPSAGGTVRFHVAEPLPDPADP